MYVESGVLPHRVDRFFLPAQGFFRIKRFAEAGQILLEESKRCRFLSGT